MQAMIVDITADNFQQMVLENSFHLPVLVDFWAPWCGPCKQILPQLENLAQGWAGRFILAKINTEEQTELANQFQIRSIPSFKLYKNGKVIAELQGAHPLAKFKEMLEPHLKPEPSEELRLQAQEAFQLGNYDEVVRLLGEAAQANPNNYRVHLDLVKMYLHTGNLEQGQSLFDKLPEEAQNSPEGKPLKLLMRFGKIVDESPAIEDIQASLREDPNNAEALYGLVGYLIIHNAFEEAFKALLKLFTSHKDFQDNIAQKTLLELFESLKDSHPELVKNYRRKLQMLMF